jgi:hypothetical protein
MRVVVAGVAVVASLLSGCGDLSSTPKDQSASGATGASGAGASGVNDVGSLAGAAAGGSAAGKSGILIPPTDGGSSVAGGPSVTHGSVACDSPAPLEQGGGYVVCAAGWMHRPSPAACQSSLPRPAADTPFLFDDCRSDSDCVASPHGFCVYGACKYGCVTDDECPADEACACGAAIGACVAAGCHSDADCPDGFPCTTEQEAGATSPGVLQCQSPHDECLTDAQCNGGLNPRVSCEYDEEHRLCVQDFVG